MTNKQRRTDATAGQMAVPASEALKAGVRLHQAGQLEEAAGLYRKVLAADPRNADANHLLGVIAFQQGRHEVAVDLIGKAISANNANAAFHSNLGNALNGMGRRDAALAAYDKALRLKPDYAEAYSNQGDTLRKTGRPDEALAAFNEALRLRPDYAEAHNNRGNSLRDLGRSDEALAAYDSALLFRPDYAKAYANRGKALQDMSRLDDALADYDTALRLKPDLAEVHNNRGNTLRGMGRPEEALAAFDTALRLKPDLAEVHNNRGNTLQEMGRPEGALAAFDAALRVKPDLAEIHNNRGNALRDLGRLDDALAAYDTALQLKPDFAEAYATRGNLFLSLMRLDEAMIDYDVALSLKPDFAEAYTSKLMALHYVAFDARGAIAAAARAFGASVNRVGAPLAFANAPIPDRRLRIGYVSGDLRRHPVGYFLQSILRNHASGAVEVFCYSNTRREDDLTASFQSQADHWRPLNGLADEAATAVIRADAIDILVDLSGHTARNRLALFARRPAPVQVSWLGYFGTTGIAAMDYVLADRFVVPPGEDDAFTEQVWRMPGSYLCFMPPDIDVPVRPRDMQGPVTFGSFNNLAKLSPHTVSLWARVMQSVPASRLFLKTKQLADAAVCQAVRERFAGHGIEADRLVLEGPSPRADLLAAYNRVDIALDPYPYGGGTTTAEALWMGAPVVTLRGGTWTGRVSESILSTVGLSDLVAGSQEAYVDLAAKLAADQDRRTALHATLRSRLAESPFCDGASFTRQLEDAYRDMWKGWCDAQGARA